MIKRIAHHTIPLFFIISSYLNCGAQPKQNSVKGSKPNIVFIFADDLGYGDLGCFGAKDIATPHIDRLAKDGIKFTDFYSGSSVCSPSRAALLTGKLPQRLGINGVFFPESFTGLNPSEKTIPEVLKEKKYATGMVGKWHLGHRKAFLPLQQGFDSFFGTPYSNDMEGFTYLRGNQVESFKVDQHYITNRYTKEAINFIEENKKNPFFLYVAHNMPHVPIYASPKFEGQSKRGLYGDVVQELDWSVGEIVKKLEKSGLLENTLIIFSSDNGPWLAMRDHGGSAGNLREGKMYTFEGGMRVPTVAMWKGKIKPNTVYNGMASQMDWLPTFASLAGVKLPKETVIDGQDISNVLFNSGKRKDSHYLFLNGKRLEAFRQGHWKVKLPYKGFKGSRWKNAVAAHDTLLFNLKNDPGEKQNLYINNKALGKKLIQEMKIKYKDMGKLTPSLVLRIPVDNSHFKYLYK